MVKSKFRKKPHVKLNSPSCTNVGRAVAGTLPIESGMRPLVVKVELYETSSPPGKRGGAVSGAGPCPLADGTQSTADDSDAKCPQRLRNNFFDFTLVLRRNSTRSVSRELTGR